MAAVPLRTKERSFLEQELARWLRLRLVTEEQRARILGLYEPARGPRRSAVAILPTILIGIAVLLLGAGLILFYAANWRRMPPLLKLSQVFALLVATYGGAYALLFSRRPHLVAGRGLLVLGMLAYGAGIALVAQIFHISAHPANGVLLWLAGVLALSALMEERWGYYLALLLALVWDSWELFVYDNPAYPFVLFPALLLYLFARKGDRAGVLLAGLAALAWFYQINVYWIAHLEHSHGAAVLAFVFLHVPLGVVLVCFSGLGLPPVFRPLAALAAVLGWLAVYVPFIGVSWPLSFPFGFFVAQAEALPIVIEYVVFAALAGSLLFILRRAGQQTEWLQLCLACAVAALLLPLGRKAVLLVATHLGLLGLLFGLLYFGHRPQGSRAERALGHILTLATLAAKGIGLFVMGLRDEHYYVAYCLGAVLFATVVFLIVQQVRNALGRLGSRFSGRLPEAAAALCIYFVIYAVSFRVSEQTSLFSADPVVIALVALLIVVALSLYAVLWARKAPRLPLGLSALVFLVTVGVILAASPTVPWQVYSLVFNVLLFVIEGVVIYYGTRVNSVALAYCAMGGLVLQVVTRYFDLFWDLLSGSLLFMVTGVLVFGGGFFLERLRRRVVRETRQP